MSFLNTLGKYLFLGFAKDWLKIDEVCMLDASLTNVQSRSLFLSILNSVQLIYKGTDRLNFKFLVWLEIRNISVSCLCLDNIIQSKCENEIANKAFTLLNNTLKVLNFGSNIAGTVNQLARWVVHINLDEVSLDLPKLTTTDFQLFLSGCPQLLALNLTIKNANIDELLVCIGEGCPHLTDLTVMSGNLSDIGDDAIHNLVSLCSRLTSIDLFACGTLSSKSILSIAEHCNARLVSLNVLCDTKDSRLTAILSISLVTLVNSCSSLTLLSVQNVVSDTLLIAIATQCTKLTSLDMSCQFTSRANNHTPQGIAALCQHCKYITYLNIRAMRSLEFESILLIAREMTHIRSIEFYQDKLNFNDCAFPVFAAKFESIVELNLVDCKMVGTPYQDATIHANIAGVLSTDKPNFRIQSTSVIPVVKSQCGDSLTTFIANGALTTALALQLLISCGSTLTDLNFHYLTSTNATVKTILPAIATHCTRLINLTFTDTTETVSHSAVERLVSVFKQNLNLRSFEYGSCINDECVVKLSEYCTKLRHIKLTSNYITDCSIESLANNCKLLRSVDITSCPLVTKTGTQSLINACTDLIHLKFDLRPSGNPNNTTDNNTNSDIILEDSQWIKETKRRYDSDYDSEEDEEEEGGEEAVVVEDI